MSNYGYPPDQWNRAYNIPRFNAPRNSSPYVSTPPRHPPPQHGVFPPAFSTMGAMDSMSMTRRNDSMNLPFQNTVSQPSSYIASHHANTVRLLV